MTDDEGADIVFDCSGGEGAITQATRIVRNGGRITAIGLWGYDFKVNLDSIRLRLPKWVNWCRVPTFASLSRAGTFR